ncbi:BTAD domain-containing putative transcriptional regulator [Nonomuraea sp. NPDC046570]|uniref:AfsR/SARP family transcriptional regulator n=1 Tax=Nonomuraea sp. NPDC046570 TaxID=3155255 RepID=UPI0033EF4BBA
MEVRVSGRPVRIGGRRPATMLAVLLLDGGRGLPPGQLVDAVWGEDPPASVRGQVAITVSVLRKALRSGGADPDIIETVGHGYRLRVGPDRRLPTPRGATETRHGEAAAQREEVGAQCGGAGTRRGGITAQRGGIGARDRESETQDGSLAARDGGFAAREVYLDARTAEERIRVARAAARDGRAAEAAVGLREALALWRGPVLAGLDCPGLAAGIMRLEELRLTLMEECADLELALGRHQELAAELAAFVTGNPLRERARAQLMLALYRSGRRADALAAFRDGRQLLSVELGIDPGPELIRMERAVLADDPALALPPAPPATIIAASTRAHPTPGSTRTLAAPGSTRNPATPRSTRTSSMPGSAPHSSTRTPATLSSPHSPVTLHLTRSPTAPDPAQGTDASGSARIPADSDSAESQGGGVPVQVWAVPAELPPATPAFTGRDAEVEHLGELLTCGPGGPVAIVAITGSGGTGKSALAVHAAHQVAKAFPDGQLYVDLRGSTPGAVPLEPLDVLGRFLRSLGVDASRVPGDTAEAAGRFRTLTAERRLLVLLDNAESAAQIGPLLPSGPGCAVIVTARPALTTVDGATALRLGPMDDEQALGLLARLAGAARVAAEPETAREIVRLCERLPLAVRITAARMAAHPSQSLAELAVPLSAACSRLDSLAYADLAVRASFAVSIEQLPGDPPGALVFAHAGLLDATTLTPPLAAALARVPQERARSALDTLVEAGLMEHAGRGRYRMHDLVRLYARELAFEELCEEARAGALRRTAHHYLATMVSAADLLDVGAKGVLDHFPLECPGVDLPDRDAAIAWLDGERENLVASVGQLASVPAAHAATVKISRVMTLPFINRGWGRDLRGLQAVCLRATSASGDREGQAHAHGGLGVAAQMLGDHDASRRSYEQALALWRELGDRNREASTLFNLITPNRGLGHLKEALGRAQEALEIATALGNRRLEAKIHDNLGLVYRALGRLDDSVKSSLRALALCRELGATRGAGSALGNLAETYRRQGDTTGARECFGSALELIRQCGYRYGEAECLWGLGRIEQEEGRLDLARPLWTDSVSILRDIGLITATEAHAILAEPVPSTPDPIRRET